MLTAKDAAAILGVSRRRIVAMIHQGIIRRAKKFGSNWAIPDSEIKRLQQEDRPPGRPKTNQ